MLLNCSVCDMCAPNQGSGVNCVWAWHWTRPPTGVTAHSRHRTRNENQHYRFIEVASRHVFFHASTRRTRVLRLGNFGTNGAPICRFAKRAVAEEDVSYAGHLPDSIKPDGRHESVANTVRARMLGADERQRARASTPILLLLTCPHGSQERPIGSVSITIISGTCSESRAGSRLRADVVERPF